MHPKAGVGAQLHKSSVRHSLVDDCDLFENRTVLCKGHSVMGQGSFYSTDKFEESYKSFVVNNSACESDRLMKTDVLRKGANIAGYL